MTYDFKPFPIGERQFRGKRPFLINKLICSVVEIILHSYIIKEYISEFIFNEKNNTF